MTRPATDHTDRQREPLRFLPLSGPCAGDATRYIIATVAAEWGLTAKDLIGQRRVRRVAWARHCAIAAVRRERVHLSLPNIGLVFGGRDHTTILNSIRRFDELSADGRMAEYRRLVAGV